MQCVRIRLAGHVQGVGFRPFVYRLARAHEIKGHVQNQLGEVAIVARGSAAALSQFEAELISKAPPLSKPAVTRSEACEEDIDFDDFEIIASSNDATAHIFVPPDYFMCDDCRTELADRNDRRHGYPFINCTQCGPRYTLIESLPYDRPNTSMKDFPLCAACEAEYTNPLDRRFHAEPIACPVCGPTLQLEGSSRTSTDEILDAAVSELQNAGIVAVKGIGGYHLMCDASNAAAVATLRQRKRRPDKPLAVMFPLSGADSLDAVRQHARLEAPEAALISSPARPIVLLAKAASCSLADNIAPGLSEIGAFLPYSPLHSLLLDRFGGPLVATSGNISGEPVLTDNEDASTRLSKVADAFVHHNRPIVRPADDSVFRRISGEMRPLRLGRGSAPVELAIPWRQDRPVLAVGGHMKGALAISWDKRVVVSPHIGEMDSPRSLAVFEQVATDLQELYGVQAERIVCDAHSGYTTHRWAKQQSLPVTTIWHHEAHASAVAAEFALPGQWLMFTWDGVGLGEDGTLWGGEGLLGHAGNWRRVCSQRAFRLPGGERAGREPWRSAAALFWEAGLDWANCPDESGLLQASWHAQMNSPVTTAAGRLFDAAAAIICGPHITSFEAQGPMILESLCREARAPVTIPLQADNDGVLRGDWAELLVRISDDKISKQERAELFHSSMAQLLVDQATAIRNAHNVQQVGLAGGVFQNRVLTELVCSLLHNAGFTVLLPRQLPCNDAAICYGQAAQIAAQNGIKES